MQRKGNYKRSEQEAEQWQNLNRVRCAAEKHGGIEASTMVIFIAAAILADF